MSRRTIVTLVRLRSWALLAGVLGACAAPTPRQSGATAAVWPLPPDPPRVRLVSSLPEQPRTGAGFWHRVWTLLTGLESARSVAHLERPHGLVVVGQTLWAADPDAGVVWRLRVGSSEATAFGCSGKLALRSPVGLAADGSGTLFVADSEGGKVVVLGSDGRCLSAVTTGLERPTGVSYDARRDHLVVVDAGRHQVLVLSRDGAVLQTIGGRGEGDGAFNFPTHVAVSPGGDIFVVDALNFVVQRFDGETGEFRGKLGGAGDVAGYFSRPKGVAVDDAGNVYVVDALQDQVFVFDAAGELLLGFGKSGDAERDLSLPTGIALGPAGRIYVADSLHHRVQVYERTEGTAP